MIHGEGRIQGKERKHYLARRRLISCAFCRYHRVENRGRQVKDDRHKNISRDTIRKEDFSDYPVFLVGDWGSVGIDQR